MNTKFFYCTLFFVAFIGSIVFVLHVPNFTSTAHRAKSYEEALQQFSSIEKAEAQLPLSLEGRSQLLVHGTPAEHVFVLLHGLSSCPEQFASLGKILFNRGANVVILRARDAGYADIFNKEQNAQSGQDLINQAAESLDIAAGLGSKITLVGISASALAAAWMAEHREGIDHVVLISPFFAPYGWPLPMLDVVTAFLVELPNFYIWKKNPSDQPNYVYRGYGSQCIAKTLELSRAVRSFKGKLKMRRLDVLLSGADHVINSQLAVKVAQQWKYPFSGLDSRKVRPSSEPPRSSEEGQLLRESPAREVNGYQWNVQNPEKIFEYEFPASLDIAHDCIDPNMPHSNTDLSYPVILKMLNGAE